ncbi:hypothetical protein SAMN05444695_105244 [Rhodococcus triatomae]|uniref:DUF8021 domain-containing protein n=1 Tax=Rhodococcus triatomae TaxID=300028 RepID=A0A1G8ID74_9NOCA|nr:hypothetical protein SAMN05444695_105244 [Rhodococcus triatomae]
MQPVIRQPRPPRTGRIRHGAVLVVRYEWGVERQSAREGVADEQVAVARAYLDALISHDGYGVPIAPGAVRYEVGLKTARNGRHLRNSLTSGPQFRLVRAIRDATYSVDGDDVIVDYLLDAGMFGRTWMTVQVHEIFRIPVDDCRIHRIDARIRPYRGTRPTAVSAP